MRDEMKPRYRLYRRRNGVFYAEDTQTHKQQSLKTRVEDDAVRLVHAKNEACALPAINRQIGQIYLRACDPEAVTRTWQFVMEQLVATKTGAATRRRWGYAIRNNAYDTFRHLPVLETPPELFLEAMRNRGPATNTCLRQISNFALDMNWMPTPIIPKKKWPPFSCGDKL